jgi:hypothetical protein
MCYWAPNGKNGKLQKKNRILETDDERRERKKRQAKREMKKAIDEEMKDANEEKKKEEQKEEDRFQEWKKVNDKEEKYEALSWCWGNQEEDYALLINRGKKSYRKRVRKELALALKYLRRAGNERTLWIDAICINQADPNERNHQVQMMSRIYTRAQQVCIWLGEADTDSEIAIKFIKDEMEELKNFDVISSNEKYSGKWQALMSLMQRDWFFRRWVVQEIALSSAATVYCGPHEISWKSFAVAVELFVEVETATHRLSEVMKRDEKFRHVPGWFEYVSELGASLLVQATGKVFRTKRSPLEPDSDSSDDDAENHPNDQEGDEQEREQERQQRKLKKVEKRIRERLEETQTIDPLERRSLLSLEYLVSTMFIFQASEPRDVVYSLLAIARDASPFAPAHYGQEDQKLFLIMTLLDRFLAEKPFMVDYSRPYSDVSRDFVEFSIKRTYKTDPHQALDILCRPWALEPPTGKSIRLKRKKTPKTTVHDEPDSGKRRLMLPPRKEWKRLNHETNHWEIDTRSNEDYLSEGKGPPDCPQKECTHSNEPNCLQIWWQKKKDRYFPSKDRDDIGLPSWVARTSQAPFMLDHAPGMDMRKTSRANADPLVGSPTDGHRNYNAAGSEKLDINTLKFKKRPVLGHYSLYVNGFELDQVEVVADASQLGSIPKDWLKLGGWEDLNKDPPDHFWRTIVADRGRDNRNPPYYYARACKESVNKGGHLGGSVNTAALINDEQNSIIAEFCRRVHAVIWNRCLFKTKKGRLGLANKVEKDDKVCILYGCTVPVILKQRKKAGYDKKHSLEAQADRLLESEEDKVEILKARVGRARSNRERRAKYKSKKKEYSDKGVWEEMMDARQQFLRDEEEKKNEGEQEQAVKERKKQTKKEQDELMKTWAKSVKQAIEEVRKASVAETEPAQGSVEKALADQQAAHDEAVVTQKAAAVAAREAAITAMTTTQTALDCNTASITAQKAAISAAAAVQDAVDRSAAVADAVAAAASAAKTASTAVQEAMKQCTDACDTQDAAAAAAAALAQEETAAAARESPDRDAAAADSNTNWKKFGDATGEVTAALRKTIEAQQAIIDALNQFNKVETEMVRIMNSAKEAAGNTVQVSSNESANPSIEADGSEYSQPTPGTPATSKGEAEGKNVSKEDWRDLWYEFKGECYLHGMMDGEAMREKLYKDLGECRFELR